MKIIVLGSGLLGVTTAYELGRRGHEVAVIDRQAESGRECSYANGGELSYSWAEPWATPGLLPKLPKWLLDPSSPLVFRLRVDPLMWKWAWMFLKNCTAERAAINCSTLLMLGMYSKRKLEEIRRDTGIEFDYAESGVLHIYGARREFDAARQQADFQAKFGNAQRVLSRDECLNLEPALKHSPATISGGIHAFGDEIGDAFLYCNALAKVAAARHGVTFHYGVTIKKLLVENETIAAVETSQGEISADAYVMALGAYSALHLRRLGIPVPVYPMKGYSVTLPADEFCPQGSIADDSRKIVYTRLGTQLRVAGTAEFAGYNDRINNRRVAPIVKAGKATFPKIDWGSITQKWACLRPSTPDGPPIVGRTPYANLYLNTGHGTLGWTQAAGSAAITADIVEGKTPEILTPGISLERYL